MAQWQHPLKLKQAVMSVHGAMHRSDLLLVDSGELAVEHGLQALVWFDRFKQDSTRTGCRKCRFMHACIVQRLTEGADLALRMADAACPPVYKACAAVTTLLGLAAQVKVGGC